MGTTNIYNVGYHFEIGGRICSPTFEVSLAAAAQDYNTLVAVMNNNSASIKTTWPGATLVIDSVQADPSGTQTVFT